MSSWLLLLLCSALCLLFTHLMASRRSGNSKNLRLPPGPRGLPFIGSLHTVGKLPHRGFDRLAKLYGPIVYMKLGAVPTVVVSSPLAAEHVLRTHDILFANRPQSDVFTYMSYGLKSFAYTGYGPQWRSLRKLAIAGLMSSGRVESSRAVRAEETDRLVAAMREAATAGEPVNLIALLRACMGDVVCRLVMGRKFMQEKVEGMTFAQHFNATKSLLGSFDLTCTLPPFLASLDLQGLRRRAKKLRVVLDGFLDGIIDEHLADKGAGREPDFLDFLLSKMEESKDKDVDFQMDREHVKAVAKDIFEGGLDSTPITVEWAFAEILKHPRVMKKIKEELASVVGADRVVDESDLHKLDYLGMVVKEVLRFHAIAPLMFHYNKEDCMLDSFHIPAGANVIVNIWALGRDPDTWSDGDEFRPERFADKNIDFRGLDYGYLPFGAGRRICPGLQLSHTTILLMLAKLLHCFDWELPTGMSLAELDMEETYCLALFRTNQLWAVPKPAHRLAGEVN